MAVLKLLGSDAIEQPVRRVHGKGAEHDGFVVAGENIVTDDLSPFVFFDDIPVFVLRPLSEHGTRRRDAFDMLHELARTIPIADRASVDARIDVDLRVLVGCSREDMTLLIALLDEAWLSSKSAHVESRVERRLRHEGRRGIVADVGLRCAAEAGERALDGIPRPILILELRHDRRIAKPALYGHAAHDRHRDVLACRPRRARFSRACGMERGRLILD